MALIIGLCGVANAGIRQDIIVEAQNYLGCRYVYATEGPKTFDCSGFTYYLYKTIAEIELPRSAKDQGYCEEYQRIENIEDLEVGDIVCWNTNKNDSDLSDHVGIYLGNGEAIHCSSGAGEVIISSIIEEDSYYHNRFSWGLKILPSEESE